MCTQDKRAVVTLDEFYEFCRKQSVEVGQRDLKGAFEVTGIDSSFWDALVELSKGKIHGFRLSGPSDDHLFVEPR